MKLSDTDLATIAGGRPILSNIRSIVTALDGHGATFGLDHPHRLVHFLAQVAHESGGFKYDREIWGPTPAQRRYEGRRDLGNTVKGDGSRFRGRGPIQITGRANYTAFAAWARQIDPAAPDFVREPGKVNTDPWEGLGPLWYWAEGNPTGRSLNVYADRNDIEMITRRINGGLNGFQDRIDRYVRTALHVLGYALTRGAVARFQADAGLKVDDIAGPLTRAALHRRLQRLDPPARSLDQVRGGTPPDRSCDEVGTTPDRSYDEVGTTPDFVAQPDWFTRLVTAIRDRLRQLP